MTDQYGNDIEIFYDEDGEVSGMTIQNSSGSYEYTVEEMEGSANLLSLLHADGVDLETTIYAQSEEMEYSDLSEEDKEYIRRYF